MRSLTIENAILSIVSRIATAAVGQKRPYGFDTIKLASATHTTDVRLRNCLSRRLQISV